MSQYEAGLVSVIMPTYKRSEMLIRAIESVFNQTYHQIELILVNDNEPDDRYTVELKEKIVRFEQDSRFNFIIQDKHINGAVARNVGIKKSKGEYIAFLDDDDWWKPNKIETQVEMLKNLSSDWGGVSCKIERYNNETLVSRQPLYPSGNVYKEVLMLNADYETGTLLLRHDALDDVGYFDPALLRHQDLQLLVNFTYKYKLMMVDEYLHCRDISDSQNRPNVEKIINAKKAFFESVKPIIDSLSKSEKRQMVLLNKAEVGYVQLKNKDYLHAAGSLIGLLSSPKSLLCVVRKMRNRIQSSKL